MDFNTVFANEAFKIDGHSVQVWSFVLGLLVLASSIIFIPRFQRWFDKRFEADTKTDHKFLKASTYLLYVLAAIIAINLLGVYDLIKAELAAFHKEVSTLLDLRLFSIGKSPMTVWSCFYVFALTWILIRSTEKLNSMVSSRLLSKTKLDRGFVEVCASTVKYCVMVFGAAVILQTAGIDLSALSFVAGAAGIAIGLGLQALMNNVVSGFVILVDRPIRIGDRIDISGVTGDVSRISLRATTVVTNDGVAVIVPNAQFISTQVVNWTYIGRTCRFRFPLTTARGASPALIQRLLAQVAQEHPGVAKEPAAKVCFDEIGESTLKFSLSVWTSDYLSKPGDLRSDINYAIAKKFADNGLGLDGLALAESTSAGGGANVGSIGAEMTDGHGAAEMDELAAKKKPGDAGASKTGQSGSTTPVKKSVA